MSGIGSIIGTFIGGLFAEGGVVPGTGNRDTVPIMATPGEFVINKRASEKFGPMLAAINSGRIGRYASGGLVGVSVASPSMAVPVGRGHASQQVFNINVTGDISRQTKSEIIRMIPQITGGVNDHNRERGYRYNS